MRHFLLILFMSSLSSLIYADSEYFNDNLLFAFDKCRSFKLDLDKTQIEETFSKSFDLHCKESNSDKALFKCDYFDTGSDKRRELENFTTGRHGADGTLISKSGTKIHLSITKGTASFESLIPSPNGLTNTKKLCVGIFLFEKDALKRKK